jgi:putative membrane protein
MGFIFRVLINAIALWAADALLPGISHEGGLTGLLLVAVIFGLLNAIIRPILALLTCPLQVVTLGLFTLVLNAGMLMLLSVVATQLGLDFRVDGWLTALIGGLIVSIVSILLSMFVRDSRERR